MAAGFNKTKQPKKIATRLPARFRKVNKSISNMAKIKKPSINRKGAPPAEFEASTNLERSPNRELKPLNFKVPAEFKREFKTYATSMDISMVELLQKCFENYKNSR